MSKLGKFMVAAGIADPEPEDIDKPIVTAKAALTLNQSTPREPTFITAIFPVDRDKELPSSSRSYVPTTSY